MGSSNEIASGEDLDDPAKWERLQQWCADATAHDVLEQIPR